MDIHNYVICRLHGLFTAIHSSTVQTIEQVGEKSQQFTVQLYKLLNKSVKSTDLWKAEISHSHICTVEDRRCHKILLKCLYNSQTPNQRYVSVHFFLLLLPLTLLLLLLFLFFLLLFLFLLLLSPSPSSCSSRY